MFSELWELAFENYKKQKLRNEYIKKNRIKFRYQNKKIRENFNRKHKHLAQKEYSLIKYVLRKNSIDQLNKEFYFSLKNYYNYYINHDINFLKYDKIGDKIYMVYLRWDCYNLNKRINDGYKFNIKFKFYQKHDYPYELSKRINRIIFDHNIYVNSYIKQYVYETLMNLWNVN